MAYVKAQLAIPQIEDANGNPATGYTISSYIWDTSTPLAMYTSSAGAGSATSFTLNSLGQPQSAGGTAVDIFLNTASTYKFIITDANGTQVGPTIGPVYPSSGDSALDTLTVVATDSTYGRSLADRFADVVSPKNWQDLVVDGDWEPAISAAIAACPEYGIVQLDGEMTIGSTITIATDNITIQGPAKLTAKASTNFEYMVYGTGLTGVLIKNIELDANKTNRTSGQNVRLMCAGFASSTDCGFTGVTARNARGYGGISAVGLVLSGSTRCHVDNCDLVDCGDSGYDADGVFTSGTQNTIANSRAYNCTDTGFVIENSDYSEISGCSTYDCAAAAAITVTSDTSRYGNVINGLTVRNWDAPSTGGIQIGTLSGTGNLYDSNVSGVTMRANTGGGYGDGAGIWIRKVGTGEAVGVTINGLVVTGADYGVRVDDGTNVCINGATIKGVTSSVYFVDGDDHSVKNSHLEGGDYGVLAANAAVVDAIGNTIRGQAIGGITALDTSTVNNFMNVFRSLSGTRITKDAGANVNSMGHIATQPVLTSNVLTNGVAGTLAKKVEVYDHNAASQGFLYLYTT